VQREGSAPLLQADRGKLDTLFENLLINAMRFSPVNGVIAITVRGATETVEVMVCDQGPGVAEEDRAHLFKPFFQGSRQPPAAATGSGLGLAIAREYAQLHGGDIELCQTQGDGGACFCVHLPLRPDLPAAQGKAHAVAAAANTDQSEAAGALEGDPESPSDWVSTQPSDDKG
jgi:two-component system sensor histidine kinase GlrK